MKLFDIKGQALVELALSIFLLLLIVFGITEFGRVMYMRSTLNNAAREGARMAAVTPSLVDASKQTQIRDYVKTCAPFDPAKMNVTIETTPAAFPSGCTISVVVTYPFQTVVPVLIPQLTNPDNSFTLTGRASMKYEY